MRYKILSIILSILFISIIPQNLYAGEISTNTFGDMNVMDANTDLVTGGVYVIVIKKDNTAWEWGYNRFGDPMNWVKDARKFPVKVLSDVKVVCAGGKHTLAIKNDGSLWAWGKNDCGQLGTGNTEPSEVPVKIMDDVLTVSAGIEHSIAIKKDGTLWGWGLSETGELGFKNKIKGIYYQVTPIKLMDDVSAVSAGGFHTMVIKRDGSLWGTGGMPGMSDSRGGTVVDGKSEINYEFVKVMDNAVAVSAGKTITAVIKNDGSLWTWEVGKPSKQLDNVTAVSVGYEHVLAIKSDGNLWAWGSNTWGAVGNGTESEVKSPIKVLDDVVDICAGSYSSFAQKKDGSLWAWGSNYTGELGNGSTWNSLLPLKVFDQMTPPIKYNAENNIHQTAIPAKIDIFINGKQVTFSSYNINGYNYLKLRDIAIALNGTSKQFEVEWDSSKNSIILKGGNAYTSVGGELQIDDGTKNVKEAVVSTSLIYLDGKNISSKAYNIDNRTYFKLRDIAAAIDFSIAYDNITKIIGIDTTNGYSVQ